jgi:hypothetical protein
MRVIGVKSIMMLIVDVGTMTVQEEELTRTVCGIEAPACRHIEHLVQVRAGDDECCTLIRPVELVAVLRKARSCPPA